MRKNKFPFFVLFIIHTSIILFTLYKKKDEQRELSILLFINVGLAYIFEYIVFNVLRAYRYKPRVMKNKYIDNTFGALLSQAIIIPFTAVFLTAFKFGKKGKIFFSLYFLIVECIFVKLGVFTRHWWKTYLTPILVFLYFLISDYSYKKIKERNRFILSVSLFFCINVMVVNGLYFLAAFGRFKIELGKWSSWREHFIIAPLYGIILSLFATWQIQKRGFLPQINILLFANLMDWVLRELDVVKLSLKGKYDLIIHHLAVSILISRLKALIYKQI
ncbi:hypothetical protein [Litchfieldia alkalitelluris]|uniref:hypothetical protein n=1 Tax=Litchfieldia alkalitelluris TaxID=304268 RepID=UPI000996C7D1|nr:hypothetical protein [Litchfieldia alkalitelluris]